MCVTSAEVDTFYECIGPELRVFVRRARATKGNANTQTGRGSPDWPHLGRSPALSAPGLETIARALSQLFQISYIRP